MVRETVLWSMPGYIVYSVVCMHRLAKIKEWVDARDPGATIIPFSGALELKVLPKLFYM